MAYILLNAIERAIQCNRCGDVCLFVPLANGALREKLVVVGWSVEVVVCDEEESCSVLALGKEDLTGFACGALTDNGNGDGGDIVEFGGGSIGPLRKSAYLRVEMRKGLGIRSRAKSLIRR